MWYKPTLGNFSCSYAPWFIAEARADTGNDCPGSIAEAWDNSTWAMGRWSEIQDERETTGSFYGEDGARHTVVSGDEKGQDAEYANRVLREVGAQSDRSGRYPAATHVEVKIAALMREAGFRKGVVIINHKTGPCGGTEGLSCKEVLPLILSPGTTLRVWYMPLGSSTIQHVDFTGR